MSNKLTSHQTSKIFIWGLVSLYIFSLPYAIILFQWLLNTVSLSTLKLTPFAVILLLGLAYLWTSVRTKQGYHLVQFIIPSTVLLIAVVALESNPIKYLHIPQYVLLTWLLYLGLQRPDAHQQVIVVSAVICACLFGLIDEVHHGIHSDRYYGWKDMLINAVGSIVGGLFLNTRISRITASPKIFKLKGSVLIEPTCIALISVIVIVYSLLTLFSVAAHSAFVPYYPSSLFTANLSIFGFSSIYLLYSHRRLERSYEFELLFFWPILVLALLHALIAFAYYVNVPFQ